MLRVCLLHGMRTGNQIWLAIEFINVRFLQQIIVHPFFRSLPNNPSSPQLTITNLLENTSYAFIVTAIDSAGNESVPSNEELIMIKGLGTSSSGSSSLSTYTTSSEGIGMLALLTPVPGSTLTSTSVTFTGGP